MLCPLRLFNFKINAYAPLSCYEFACDFLFDLFLLRELEHCRADPSTKIQPFSLESDKTGSKNCSSVHLLLLPKAHTAKVFAYFSLSELDSLIPELQPRYCILPASATCRNSAKQPSVVLQGQGPQWFIQYQILHLRARHRQCDRTLL